MIFLHLFSGFANRIILFSWNKSGSVFFCYIFWEFCRKYILQGNCWAWGCHFRNVFDKFNFFNKNRVIQIFCFLCHFSKELIYFITVVEIICMKVSLYFLVILSVFGICNDIPSFIIAIGNLYLFFLIILVRGLSILIVFFKKSSFAFIKCCLFSIFWIFVLLFIFFFSYYWV